MISNKHFFIKKSQWLRKEIFEMVIRVNQGHIASAFSQCEILISLFYGDKYCPNCQANMTVDVYTALS